MKPTIPDPKYEAYIIRPSNVGVQVHAFKSKAAAERVLATWHSMYALQLPEGKLIALVGSIESAHATLLSSARRAQVSHSNIELWIR